MAKELYKFDMSGLDNVWLVNGFTWHDTPYGKAIQIEDGEALTRAIAHARTTQTRQYHRQRDSFFTHSF